MQLDRSEKICAGCPCRTPLKSDPETIQRARELYFEPPLDEGIKEIVHTLIAAGVETFESCEGSDGHAFAEPIVRFEGSLSEGLRAVSVAIAFGFPVADLRRTWEVRDDMLHGPWWEMTFTRPRPATNSEKT
jgi:hypothetical protein